MGPFDVMPEAVGRLGAAFAPFVNDLLSSESGRAGMLGHKLEINTQYNTPDGGVDAALESTLQTDWLPVGQSVWQFKSSDLSPAECRSELRGASFAIERMREGANYVLVLGRPLVKQLKDDRAAALEAEAEELGLDPARTLLYDGNQLARWASSFPARSLDRRLGGPGPALLDFDRWSGAHLHQGRWVPCESRSDVEQAVRSMQSGGLKAYRVEGESGLGKTRLVMESLRNTQMRSLVVCAPRAADLTTEALGYLVDGDRSCLLVVDNCSRSEHQSILEQIRLDSMRVITIGDDARDRLIQTPYNDLLPATPDEVESILRANALGIWPEAIRVVTANCFGNVRTALLLAERLVQSGETAVAALLQQDDFRALIRELLPADVDFFSATVLALVERVGWDRDLRYQLEALAQFAGVEVQQLELVGSRLEDVGLLERQGRYRAVSPLPVAVLLSADAWASDGARVVDELLPNLDSDMARALFRRCADLGRYGPARDVLNRLLAYDGSFGSLESIDNEGTADVLVQLAIVMPERTALHLSELVSAESLDQLRSFTRSRRGIVNALEKLVWHSETFESAADALLRLALAENETWANNATGQFSALFGARLPATAAGPEHRATYLARVARNDQPEARELAARAAANALSMRESAFVSGELQGGAVVAPRGSAQAGDQLIQYLLHMIGILDALSRDSDQAVAEAARRGLVSAIHPFLAVPQVGEALATSLSAFRGEALQAVRRAIEDTRRHSKEPAQIAAGRRLERLLPERSSEERLLEMLDLSPWAWQMEPTKSDEFDELVDRGVREGWMAPILLSLQEAPVASAWHLGKAIGARADFLPDARQLIVAAAAVNAPALAGFLRSRVDAGELDAFDQFFEQAAAESFDASTRLYLSCVGPMSEVARDRILLLSTEVPLAEAAGRLLHLQEALADRDVDLLLSHWRERIATETDYAALIDWIAMFLHRGRSLPSASQDQALELLGRRREYADLGNARWDWCELARHSVGLDPVGVASTVLDLVASDQLLLLSSDPEAGVLVACGEADPLGVWGAVVLRVSNGDWRVAMSLRGWYANTVSEEIVLEWVGDSSDRGRLVAGLIGIDDEDDFATEPRTEPVVPNRVAIELISRFPDDEQIWSSLAGDFYSGSWVGPWSGRVRYQLELLESWRADPTYPRPFKEWTRRLSRSLESQLTEALEREAEERF